MKRAGIAAGLLLLLATALEGPPLAIEAAAARPLVSLAVVAAGLALPFVRPLRPLFAAAARAIHRPREGAFLFAIFACGTGLYAWSHGFVLNGAPRLDDEVAAIFQARVFAIGKIVLPLPTHAWFFEQFGVLGARAARDHWTGMYPPGWPLLLTPGVWLGATWLVNPVLGGLLAVAVAQLGRLLFGRGAGRVAGLFALLSPLVLVLAGSHLSSVAAMLFGCWCAVCACRMLATGRWWWGLLAGMSFGMAFLCRPLSALVVGIAVAVLVLARWRAALRVKSGVAAAVMVALLAGGALAGYQHITTGRYNLPGHKVGMGPRGRMGFVKLDRARTHTVEAGLEYTGRRIRALDDTLQGWPLGAFALMSLPFLARRARGREYWPLLPWAGLLAAFMPYWYYDMYYPGQYVAECAPMLFVLMARGWRTLEAFARKKRRVCSRLPGAIASAGYLFVASVSNPSYLSNFHEHYGDVELVLPRVIEHYGISNAVVFMDGIGEGTDRLDPMNTFYASGFRFNDLALTGSVIYARNMKERNGDLMEFYPGRSYYFYRFNRATSRARLYTITPFEGGYRMTPVAPRENEWLEPAPALDPVDTR